MGTAAVGVGFVALVTGVALVHYPSALILVGVLLMLFGLFYDDGNAT